MNLRPVIERLKRHAAECDSATKPRTDLELRIADYAMKVDRYRREVEQIAVLERLRRDAVLLDIKFHPEKYQ